MNIRQRDPASLEKAGDAQLAAGDAAAAAESYAAAAGLVEVPPGGLSVKCARAELQAGRPERAAAALMPVVDTAPDFKTWTAAAGLLGRCPVETWPGIRRQLRVGLVGTWTTSAFAPLFRLAAARLGVALTVREPDFGQYFNTTLNPDSALLADGVDALVLAPDHRALGVKPFTDTPEADAAAEVARWSGVWEAVRRRAAPLVVQMGFALPGGDPLGHHAAAVPGSRRRVVAEINRGLAERAAAADVGFLDTAELARRLGSDNWFDDRSWYVAKMPFAAGALPLLARHAAAVLAARLGLSRRVAVVDLDNTLWGGVIGDDGLEGIVLGGGSAGEAYQDFQAALKELTGRGILLAVCSKNDPDVALSPFREHPEMVLREEDIAAFAASWGPKSDGIRQLAERLSLGLDSFTFLDDNPYERAEVRRALPQVDVPLLPEDPTGFRRALEAYPYFEPATFTAADRDRAKQYRARAAAEALKADAGSLEEYQASLGMEAEFGAIDAVNMPRVVQLINKTNQFNLTTVRRNQAELEALLARDGTRGFWVRLRDKFADHGLIAVALAEVRGEALAIDTLLMSCRVLGRGVEALILAELARIAQAAGCRTVEGRYRPSARNGMVADLYPRLGFEERGRGGSGETLWQADPARLTAPGVPIHVTWRESPAE
jgi:FkbH-like protein